MLAAGARRLQTVISIQVQPTEDLPLLYTLVQILIRAKKRKTSDKRRRIKRLNETKQTASEETFIIRAHWSWFSDHVISGDFLFFFLFAFFIPIQIKIVLQKVQVPPKFKGKSFDEPRKTFDK